MASDKSYAITLRNNLTEKAAIGHVMSADRSFLNPSLDSRKHILEMLAIPVRFPRAFDLMRVPGHISSESEIRVEVARLITFVELKTTKKLLLECPKGLFFGATENEFKLLSAGRP